MSNDLRIEDFEPASIPANETPRQFLLRITGHDFDNLNLLGHEWTWDEVREVPGMMKLINDIIDRSAYPRVLLIKRQPRKEE